MRVWKILAVIGLTTAFSAAAQAENATNKMTANKLVANRLSANRLSANGISVGQPAEGAAADIVAIELPNGIRFAR
jgi:dihydroorotase-like cyclic amidohydrolase